LASLIEAWPNLPEPIQVAIRALAASSGDPPPYRQPHPDFARRGADAALPVRREQRDHRRHRPGASGE